MLYNSDVIEIAVPTGALFCQPAETNLSTTNSPVNVPTQNLPDQVAGTSPAFGVAEVSSVSGPLLTPPGWAINTPAMMVEAQQASFPTPPNYIIVSPWVLEAGLPAEAHPRPGNLDQPMASPSEDGSSSGSSPESLESESPAYNRLRQEDKSSRRLIDYRKMREDNNRCSREYRRRKKEQEIRWQTELRREEERNRHLKTRLRDLERHKERAEALVTGLVLGQGSLQLAPYFKSIT
jgi:hypothetical protein